MDFDIDKMIKEMMKSAPEEAPELKINPEPLPTLPDRHKKFKATDSTSKDWDALYASLSVKIMNGITIALIGQRGCGKTQLAICLIKACCRAGKTSEYKKAFDIFLRIRSSNTDQYDSEIQAINDFVKPYLLVIDAFEVRGETQFETRTMDHIIDKRYDAMKSTIIISNDTKEELSKVLGESICDRMRETGGIIPLNHNSFRSNR